MKLGSPFLTLKLMFTYIKRIESLSGLRNFNSGHGFLPVSKSGE